MTGTPHVVPGGCLVEYPPVERDLYLDNRLLMRQHVPVQGDRDLHGDRGGVRTEQRSGRASSNAWEDVEDSQVSFLQQQDVSHSSGEDDLIYSHSKKGAHAARCENRNELRSRSVGL